MGATIDHLGSQQEVTDINVINSAFTINNVPGSHLVVVAWSHDPNPAVDHMTYDAVSFPPARVALSNSGIQPKRIEIWSLPNPNLGSNSLHVEWTYNQDKAGCIAVQLAGVNNGDPILDFGSDGGLDTNAAISLNATPQDMVIGGVIMAPDTATISLGSGQTIIVGDLWDAHDIRWKHSYEPGESDGVTAHTYSWSGSYNFASVAVSFRALVISGRPMWVM